MWFLGIFPQVRCGCILEPELLNGERVSVLTTQSNNVVVVGGVSSRVCSVRKSCALLPGLTLGECIGGIPIPWVRLSYPGLLTRKASMFGISGGVRVG